MRSSAGIYAINRRWCAQSYVTAQKSHGALGEMMAARLTRHALERIGRGQNFTFCPFFTILTLVWMQEPATP